MFKNYNKKAFVIGALIGGLLWVLLPSDICILILGALVILLLTIKFL